MLAGRAQLLRHARVVLHVVSVGMTGQAVRLLVTLRRRCERRGDYNLVLRWERGRTIWCCGGRECFCAWRPGTSRTRAHLQTPAYARLSDDDVLITSLSGVCAHSSSQASIGACVCQVGTGVPAHCHVAEAVASLHLHEHKQNKCICDLLKAEAAITG